ncbi:Na+/H+ antiporter subunit E [Nocardia cyriacigeorgica]|jgi:multicomponent Na+:H+ antiporter subunit E|uniref:Na+/H+ antiporter subunit E n=1 Tax=Nocardia cyriacigeorgica TaxID=135487 RepID=UPI000CE9D15D|nr:Na+/H+ antiporter subunit E [Nocardia cyriacigeorgica]AVH21857.1 Na+/H+ antiporter subunit E [Nocardia cyriacigeorgica]MBF6085657.1 Na+/H+ antiporter subunit E [Nocardia cyriacigeorgica]MBF6091747.1 Na+/H+ antiporter subunit E [Nocardia cyriacigeorgica]MBF6321371.1 Na+/H+ antiporter subunit E [Nocardia cyriacigeorgica]MBF6394617.1 Na+/H+ antiporter subunit E [Nocardia cyriacigeorgica]
MSRETVIRIAILCWLAAVWVALWGRLSVANVLAGLVVGALIMVTLPLPRVPVTGWVRPVPLIQLVAVSIYYALESSVQVAWFAIRPAPPPISGVLRVYFSFKSDLVLVLCTNLLNLIPGTMVLELDRERCVVYVHVMDVGSDKAVDKFYSTTRRLERLLIASFQRPAARSVPEVSA